MNKRLGALPGTEHRHVMFDIHLRAMGVKAELREIQILGMD